MFKKVVLITLTCITVAFSRELKLESIYLENVPSTYKEVFRDFLIKNFHIKEESQSQDKLKVNISWTGLAYTVCLNFLFLNQEEKISCFTAQSGEEFYEKFFSSLEEYQKNKPKIEKIDLPVSFQGILKGNKIRISSEDRDILVSYKPVKKAEGNVLFKGNLNVDTLYIDNEEAQKLLKLLLTGKKIRQILIIK